LMVYEPGARPETQTSPVVESSSPVPLSVTEALYELGPVIEKTAPSFATSGFPLLVLSLRILSAPHKTLVEAFALPDPALVEVKLAVLSY